jgi:AraC-like DNA-binding protein
MNPGEITIGPPEAPWTPVDPVGEALHVVHMSGVVYTRSELTAPWGIELPALPGCLMFHVVTTGRLWVEVPDAEPRWLAPGEVLLVPHGEGHRIASAPGTPTRTLFDLPRERLSERYEVLRFGGGGEPTHLMCGAVRFDHPAARRIVAMLPGLLSIRAERAPDAEWMRGTLRWMAAEAGEMRPGGEAILSRLADVLVIEAIRSWIAEDSTARSGWLGALRDPQIGRALACVHREPARPWSVAALAAEAAMSRSAFAARFAELVGEPAMRYVARWRMQVALRWLQEDDVSIAEVAGRLGYASEAAFSRAFRRVVGAWPGSVKRRRGARGGVA